MTAVICLFAVIVSSMVTVIVLQEVYNSKLHEEQKLYNEALAAEMTNYSNKIAAVEEQMAEYGEIAADIQKIDLMYREYYPGELDAEALRKYAIKGYIAGTGDRYGFYYSPDEAKALMESVEGETDGIGVNVIFDTELGCIEVIDVYPESPAEKAGVKVGDLISHVINDDGEKESIQIIVYDAALSRLRGEAGTEAKFMILRDSDGDGKYEELDFTIERAHIETVSVTHHIYEPDKTIGVIRISSFEKNTPAQFTAAVDALKAEGVQKLIFDVRHNPGGDKDSVCEILDYLLPKGDLMRTVDAEDNYTTIETSDEKFLDMPMAVVMNSGTASAGELFAAAIKDYGTGKLVGDQTFGKGSMQSIMPVFDDGSLVKLTVALYCPPTSENYDGVGIVPDVSEPLDETLADMSFYKLTDANDNQLAAAAKTFE